MNVLNICRYLLYASKQAGTTTVSFKKTALKYSDVLKDEIVSTKDELTPWGRTNTTCLCQTDWNACGVWQVIFVNWTATNGIRQDYGIGTAQKNVSGYRCHPRSVVAYSEELSNMQYQYGSLSWNSLSTLFKQFCKKFEYALDLQSTSSNLDISKW